MATLVVLFCSALFFRTTGFLLPDWFGTWVDSFRAGLAVMFSFTGISHFTPMRADFIHMVPRVLPAPGFWVSLTGISELLGAAGIVLPQTRPVAGICLIVLLAAMLPANIKASLEKIPLRGMAATRLWLRVPMQGLFAGLVWWTTPS